MYMLAVSMVSFKTMQIHVLWNIRAVGTQVYNMRNNLFVSGTFSRPCSPLCVSEMMTGPKLALFASLVASCLAQSGLTAQTPSDVIASGLAAVQCAAYQINWGGGVPPYRLHLLGQGSTNLDFNEEISWGVSSSPFSWAVDQLAGGICSFPCCDLCLTGSRGQSFQFQIVDSQGTLGWSGPFVIQPSTSSAYPNTFIRLI
jgi:hypothetical protein